MGEQTDRSAARRAILQQWMAEQERGPSWVARRIGYSRPYFANVLSGYYPFTDPIVRACHEHLGIDFGSMGIQEDVEESELLTAAALTVWSPKARRQRVCSGLSTPLLYLSWPPRGRAKFSVLCWSTFPPRGSCMSASTPDWARPLVQLASERHAVHPFLRRKMHGRNITRDDQSAGLSPNRSPIRYARQSPSRAPSHV